MPGLPSNRKRQYCHIYCQQIQYINNDYRQMQCGISAINKGSDGTFLDCSQEGGKRKNGRVTVSDSETSKACGSDSDISDSIDEDNCMYDTSLKSIYRFARQKEKSNETEESEVSDPEFDESSESETIYDINISEQPDDSDSSDTSDTANYKSDEHINEADSSDLDLPVTCSIYHMLRRNGRNYGLISSDTKTNYIKSLSESVVNRNIDNETVTDSSSSSVNSRCQISRGSGSNNLYDTELDGISQNADDEASEFDGTSIDIDSPIRSSIYSIDGGYEMLDDSRLDGMSSGFGFDAEDCEGFDSDASESSEINGIDFDSSKTNSISFSDRESETSDERNTSSETGDSEEDFDESDCVYNGSRIHFNSSIIQPISSIDVGNTMNNVKESNGTKTSLFIDEYESDVDDSSESSESDTINDDSSIAHSISSINIGNEMTNFEETNGRRTSLNFDEDSESSDDDSSMIHSTSSFDVDNEMTNDIESNVTNVNLYISEHESDENDSESIECATYHDSITYINSDSSMSQLGELDDKDSDEDTSQSNESDIIDDDPHIDSDSSIIHSVNPTNDNWLISDSNDAGIVNESNESNLLADVFDTIVHDTIYPHEQYQVTNLYDTESTESGTDSESDYSTESHEANSSLDDEIIRAEEVNDELQAPVLNTIDYDEPVTVDENGFAEIECSICLTNKIKVALNCGHTLCGRCSEAISKCHICRLDIQTRLRIYI